MYIDSWQVLVFGIITGVLLCIILSVITLVIIYNKRLKSAQKEAEKASYTELFTKLCFVLLAKGLISDADRDWMFDKIQFSEWKKSIEDELNGEDNWYK